MTERAGSCLVVGATGFIGSAVCRRLLRSGWAVSGLARDEAGAESLGALGVVPLHGDLGERLDPVLEAAAGHDATVYAAQLMLDEEEMAVHRLLDAAADQGRTFVFTSGAGVLGQLTGGAWSEDVFAEDDPFTPSRFVGRRVETEDRVRADGRCRGIVVRPPLVWGPGDHGHMALIYDSVARTGAACYVGEGLNLYSHVHVDDLADLYEAVLSRGVAGALYHAVAGEVPNRWIAETVARDLGCDTRSVTMDEAIEIWGKFAVLVILASSSRARSPRARTELGWAPRHADLLSMAGAPHLRRRAGRD